MASGLSNRFGSNKLMAEYKGKPLIGIITENTTGLGKDNYTVTRLVLTRSEEVYNYCNDNNIQVILHKLPERNDAVRLAIEKMMDMDACIFCTSDQPLLKRDSIERLLDEYALYGKGIYRLAFDNNVGNPILFSKEYFEELKKLPPKKGGAYLAAKYDKAVRLVYTKDKWELYDVDTPEDLKILNEEGDTQK